MLALLSPLASLLGVEIQTLVSRYKREAVSWAAVGLLLALGGVFLLIAANNALTLAYGPVVAPLMLAGAALFAGLVVYLVARFRAASVLSRRPLTTPLALAFAGFRAFAFAPARQ